MRLTKISSEVLQASYLARASGSVAALADTSSASEETACMLTSFLAGALHAIWMSRLSKYRSWLSIDWGGVEQIEQPSGAASMLLAHHTWHDTGRG